jgi:glutamate-1-semialdehyde aminotransferase
MNQQDHELIRRGVYCTPGGKLYLSLAHTDADLDCTLEIANGAINALRNQ